MLRLTVERKKRGWSQAEVSRLTGIHPAVLSNLEAGRAYPWPRYKRLLAELFQMEPEVLFEPVGEDEAREAIS